MNSREQTCAGLAMTASAVMCGLLWWPLKSMQALGLHPLWATAMAYGVGLVATTVYMASAWRSLSTSPALWIVLLAFGSSTAAFNWAVTTGDVVRVVFLFYLMPVWAVLLARPLLHEALPPRALMQLVLAVAGCSIVLWPEAGGPPLPQSREDLLAIGSGFLFALTNVMLRREAKQSGAVRALAVFCGGAFVAGAAGALLACNQAIPLPPSDLGRVVLPGAVLSGILILSNLALLYGATRLPASATAVILVTEVVIASLSAAAFGAGTLNAHLLVGGALILAAATAAMLPSVEPLTCPAES